MITQVNALNWRPSYLALNASGILQRRVDLLEGLLASCDICPRNCRVDRIADEIAACYSGYKPIVSAYVPHFGEEPALCGSHGVGNIFLGNCNLRCVYCQNYQISQNWRAERSKEVSIERLAEMMIELQEKGCHNIGFVSPTHFAPQIVKAVSLAIPLGLRVPLLYNTNAYDALHVLRLMDGIFDIYLPDLKYSEEEMGWKYSKVKGYVQHARAALKEMHRQLGDTLVVGEDGLVKRGLIIRHLVLPNGLAGSRETLTFIKDELSKSVTLSVMAQYYPTHKAAGMDLLNRRLHPMEYVRVLDLLDTLGLEEGWAQEFESAEYYQPDFTREAPFIR